MNDIGRHTKNPDNTSGKVWPRRLGLLDAGAFVIGCLGPTRLRVSCSLLQRVVGLCDNAVWWLRAYLLVDGRWFMTEMKRASSHGHGEFCGPLVWLGMFEACLL